MSQIYCINPRGSMEQLSHSEMEFLTQHAKSKLYDLYRNCSLAVLNSGVISDDSRELLSHYPDFKINLVTRERGIAIELHNPPEAAFVDNQMLRNIQYHLFAVLRDILFVNLLHQRTNPLDLDGSENITNEVFTILRNANALTLGENPNFVVCWGGHSITEPEFEYCQSVGRELGVRELNIITGCGAGVMEAPMRGAALGHFHQRYQKSRFVGITEPSIIASEPPNPLVNELIIMPDIEKRLEAFVRMGHGILIFPGGPGTFEEFMFILGIKLNHRNKYQTLPLILTGPKESADYFATIHRFVGETLGTDAQNLYEIIIDDPITVARKMKSVMSIIKQSRHENSESYHFNWSLYIDRELQMPFEPTHQNMANLDLHLDQSTESLVANLRRAFSGIVAGNIKPDTQDRIKEKGKFKLRGDKVLMEKIDRLLQDFIQQHRMKLPSDKPYEPCYEIVT